MSRLLILIIAVFFVGCAVIPPLHKSKLIGVFHLIEIANFDEAKKAVEEMIEDEKSMEWPRTWYARGLLCHNAYIDGMKKNDRKKFELYPDQLYVAHDSFEKALALDRKGSLEKQLAPKYVILANEFQKSGNNHYNRANYKEALRAFERALAISLSPILTVLTDTNLIYNAALAALGARERERAIELLGTLDSYNYSPNVSHLLFTTHLEQGDTLTAVKMLTKGVEKYEDNEDLILLLVDTHFNLGQTEKSLHVLDKASKNNPSSHIFPFTKGLIYQKTEQYNQAILSYFDAVSLAPEALSVHTNIATCYYNIGIEIEENARTLNNSRDVLEEKAKSAAAFESAAEWLNKAYDIGTDNQAMMIQLHQLYKLLNITEKVKSLEEKINQTGNN
jgi:tetratricopeptide (TPR) repeat protein